MASNCPQHWLFIVLLAALLKGQNRSPGNIGRVRMPLRVSIGISAVRPYLRPRNVLLGRVQQTAQLI